MDKIPYIVGLIIVAMILLLFEVLTPSFGMLLVLGLAAMAGAAWLGYTISPALGLVLVLATLVGVPAYFAVVIRILPRTSVGRRLFLGRRREPEGGGTPEAAEYAALVGKTGRAETLLRPAGAIRVGGVRYIALSESGIIQKGQTVKVIRAAGMNVIVRRAEPQET
jgi:membrane-bound serine protease (ClpP class)